MAGELHSSAQTQDTASLKSKGPFEKKPLKAPLKKELLKGAFEKDPFKDPLKEH